MSTRLFVSLSPHGYGHAAMTVPVLNRLRQLVPSLHLTIETNISFQWLTERLIGPFEYIPTLDFGMVMRSATEVDIERSHTTYLRLHTDWAAVVSAEANRLQLAKPDIIITNISYLVLAAAAHTSIPTVALCSLNWADIYQTYCGQLPGASRIVSHMRKAYRKAHLFLRALPAMPIAYMSNVQNIGPIARIGCNRQEEIHNLLRLTKDTRIGLLAFGGIDPKLRLDQWPFRSGWIWIAGLEDVPKRSDIVKASQLPMSFVDLLCSAHVVLTKPGYSTFTEAACAGVAVLHCCRGRWPEAPYLSEWLTRNTRTSSVPEERLRTGDFTKELEVIFSLEKPDPPSPIGIEQATTAILSML